MRGAAGIRSMRLSWTGMLGKSRVGWVVAGCELPFTAINHGSQSRRVDMIKRICRRQKFITVKLWTNHLSYLQASHEVWLKL